MQQRATFCTSSTWGVEAIIGLIPLYLHLKKISSKHQIKTSTLLLNHAINSLLERRHTKNSCLHCLSLENMTDKQRLKIKSSIINTNNCLNGIYPLFDFLNCKFSPRFRLIDKFSSHFSFHQANYKDKESKAAHLCNLDDIFSNASSDPKSIVVISDASIRNNIAMSISYVHSSPNNVRKTIHHTINVTSTKAKLFAIRYGINQAIQILEATHITVITGAIHTAKCIFDSIIHSY